jgi:phosphopantetheinyl transferase
MLDKLLLSSIVESICRYRAAVVVAALADFEMESLSALLSQEEYARMQRFRQSSDAHRYVLGHALKRMLLSEILKINPQNLTFGHNQYGKPFCTQEGAPYFNISHSGGYVVIAISLIASVGVDIEFPRNIDFLPILKKVSSLKQQAYFLNSTNKCQAFLCLWTQKEAVSKACGRGIGVGLSAINCSGRIESQEIQFMSNHYYLFSATLFGEGLISWASIVDIEPVFIHLVNTDGLFRYI